QRKEVLLPREQSPEHGARLLARTLPEGKASGGARRGKRHAHGGPVPQRALDLEPPVVRLDDVLHDRQAEPRATQLARARPVDAEEALRQPWQVVAPGAPAAVAAPGADAGAARRKRSASRGRSWLGMPTPVSTTVSSTAGAPASDPRRASTCTRPPSGVYLTALSIRLTRTCRMRPPPAPASGG